MVDITLYIKLPDYIYGDMDCIARPYNNIVPGVASQQLIGGDFNQAGFNASFANLFPVELLGVFFLEAPGFFGYFFLDGFRFSRRRAKMYRNPPAIFEDPFDSAGAFDLDGFQ